MTPAPVAVARNIKSVVVDSCYSFLLHLANAAVLAISIRLSGVSFSALALPPFNPPLCPIALASKTGLGLGSIYPVASWTTLSAVILKSCSFFFLISLG